MDVFANTIVPSVEIGSYEALWVSRNIKSFKKMSEEFSAVCSLDAPMPSDLIDDRELAKQYYSQILENLIKKKFDNKFGAIFRNTFDYPEKLNDAKYPLELLYYIGDVTLL